MTPLPAPEGVESITEAELEQYFQRLQSARNVMGGASSEAARIVRDIKAHRVTEYKRGEIYEDAAGHRYLRKPYATYLPWLLIGREGLVVERVESVPKRPLRKLVPLPFHDELVAVLVESITDDVNGYEGQAQRVLKLLEGGGDD